MLQVQDLSYLADHLENTSNTFSRRFHGLTTDLCGVRTFLAPRLSQFMLVARYRCHLLPSASTVRPR